MSELLCLRCRVPMHHIGDRQLQLGQTGWILGDLPNLIAGSMTVAVYACPDCGKLEFFQSGDAASRGEDGDTLPQITCPTCGKRHDFDYPKCPFCGHINDMS